LGWQISVLGAALAFGVAEESVARLYAAGVIPGLMIAVMIAAYVVWRAKSENFGDCMFLVGKRPRLASVSKAASHTRNPTALG
jgi:TRAP-type C4-dicarboxylate transport system permease large subunit